MRAAQLKTTGIDTRSFEFKSEVIHPRLTSSDETSFSRRM